jgi:hypothetical protein
VLTCVAAVRLSCAGQIGAVVKRLQVMMVEIKRSDNANICCERNARCPNYDASEASPGASTLLLQTPLIFTFHQAADHSDALQLLQTELGALSRDASFSLRIVAAVAAHSAASAGLLQFFKDHCLSFLLVLKADKVRSSLTSVLHPKQRRDDATRRFAMCGSVWLECLRCFCAWESLGAAWLVFSLLSLN